MERTANATGGPSRERDLFEGAKGDGAEGSVTAGNGTEGSGTDGAGIAWGVCRLLTEMEYRVLRELPLGNGRRVDVAAIARGGEITVVEVKASLADFKSDGKWREYLPYCDQFYFAVTPAFPRHKLPDDVGIIVANPYQGAIVREATAYAMNAARRKAVTLRFARAAAARLQALSDRHATLTRHPLRMP